MAAVSAEPEIQKRPKALLLQSSLMIFFSFCKPISTSFVLKREFGIHCHDPGEVEYTALLGQAPSNP
jgi:hypothetical protein